MPVKIGSILMAVVALLDIAGNYLLVQPGSAAYGHMLIAIGAGLKVAVVYLLEKGIIEMRLRRG